MDVVDCNLNNQVQTYLLLSTRTSVQSTALESHGTYIFIYNHPRNLYSRGRNAQLKLASSGDASFSVVLLLHLCYDYCQLSASNMYQFCFNHSIQTCFKERNLISKIHVHVYVSRKCKLPSCLRTCIALQVVNYGFRSWLSNELLIRSEFTGLSQNIS